jgi:hypothetical protein
MSDFECEGVDELEGESFEVRGVRAEARDETAGAEGRSELLKTEDVELM